MKCLIVIPHIFDPKPNSLYSSQNESKRQNKIKALKNATIENLERHNRKSWIHASLGKNKPVVTRRIDSNAGIDLYIQVYTDKEATLTNNLPYHENLSIINVTIEDKMKIPQLTSQRLLEQANEYDILGYMEDDILIEDPEFFEKIKYLQEILESKYTVIPHRCEKIPNKGNVILSGDPDGGREDLFWDTKETIEIKWPTGNKKVYRAINPHSGCFFISKLQALELYEHWNGRGWRSPFELCGPIEQAASGRLIEKLKIMKPIPEDYRFLMVRHIDNLWERHEFERIEL